MKLTEALAGTPLCSGLEPDEVERLASAGRVEHWPAGAIVMEEGEDGPRLVVLLEGEVVIQKSDGSGAEHVLGRAGPGDVLGEMSLLTGAPRTATVRASSSLKLYAIDQNTFEGMVLDGDPAALNLGLSIAKVLAYRLTLINTKFVELLEETADEDGPLQEFARFRQELFTRWNF